jgi:hypothetical protein
LPNSRARRAVWDFLPVFTVKRTVVLKSRFDREGATQPQQGSQPMNEFNFDRRSGPKLAMMVAPNAR